MMGSSVPGPVGGARLTQVARVRLMTNGINIEYARLHRIRMRLRDSFVAGGVDTRDRPALLLYVRDADGAAAWGECVALPTAHYVPETQDVAATAIGERILPEMMGRRFAEHTEVAPFLENIAGTGSMARACVEMTCWALAAEQAGVPLSALLGGTRGEVATGLALGQQDSADVLMEAVSHGFAEGYQRIKVKISPGHDNEYLQPTIASHGGERLMVDANGAYQRRDAATLGALDEFGLMMIEQPLAADDIEGHADLQKRLRTPICLDESLDSVDAGERIIASSAARVANIKPGRVGGFNAALDIEERSRQAGIPVWCGGMLETGIGRAYNVALASREAYELPGDLSPSARYWEQDIVDPAWTMNENGWVQVPDTPGIGVEVDTDRIQHLSEEIQEFWV